jgi:hypothetical protein
VLPVSFVAVVPLHVSEPLVRAKFTGSVPMLNIGSGGQSLLVGNDALIADVPATQAMPLFGPATQLPLTHSGQGWMPGMVLPGSVDVSPVRKRTDDSGAAMSVAPVLQSTVPLTSADRVLITQTLVGVLPGFGTGSGAPKKQPVDVQFLMLPVSADVAAPTIAFCPLARGDRGDRAAHVGQGVRSGTELPPPPV